MNMNHVSTYWYLIANILDYLKHVCFTDLVCISLFLWTFLAFFSHLIITFLICFSFIYIFPNNPYNLSITRFLLWSVNFIFLQFWITGKIINLIVLAAINVTGIIDNYRYNKFLVEGKNIFDTVINNSAEKNCFFKKLEIWHQWCHWLRHHMMPELSNINIFFIFQLLVVELYCCQISLENNNFLLSY